MDYNGGRTEETIVSWIQKKLNPASLLLTEASLIESMKAK